MFNQTVGGQPLQVSQLSRLLETGEYKRCLEAAASLLAEGGHDKEGQARIYAAITRSCLALTDYPAAVEAGRTAVLLAEASGSADVLGSALVDLATALGNTRRFEAALATFARYLQMLPLFTAARCLEGRALQRQADTCRRAGRPEEAVRAYRRAMRWFQRYGDDAGAIGCAQALVRLHIDQGQLRSAARLLAVLDGHARAHPGDHEFLGTQLVDRALFHLRSGRSVESAREAMAALELSPSLAVACRAQMMLAHAALEQNKPADALNFLFAARVGAIDARLYDLEFEASRLLLSVLNGPDGQALLLEVDDAYCQAGVDISHYLAADVAAGLPPRDE